MIELKGEQLEFSFADLHENARCRIEFQRTLRIPDDNREYPLPPGFGQFPLAHVDDLGEFVPTNWQRHGGIYLPMYQAEAMWINFQGDYPCAVKVAAGKVNAVTGDAWDDQLQAEPQDYVVVPDQPWLDGFCVTKGSIRQFVAMPLGEGYSAEEQITGKAEHGGLQVMVFPMRREAYERYLREHAHAEDICGSFTVFDPGALGGYTPPDMGLAPGGLMRQKIYEDEYGIDVWDTEHVSRCFVHIVNSHQYVAITGNPPPTQPPSASQYADAGLPWFDYYAEGKTAVPGSKALAELKSLAAKWFDNNSTELPDNEAIKPGPVKKLGGAKVREGEF